MNEKQDVEYLQENYMQIDNLKPKEQINLKQNTEPKKLTNVLTKLKSNGVVSKLMGIKNIKAILAVIVFVVVALVLINYQPNSNEVVATVSNSGLVDYTSSTQYIDNLEVKLTDILSHIKGAGETKVMITIESGPEIKVAEQVEEKTTTTSSGTTVTVVTNPIIINNNGEEEPLVVMEIVPKIKGVIVVSSGANDLRVRLDMLSAIQALLDVSNENIQIFTGI